LPSSVPAGTWASIPQPGSGYPDDVEGKRWYAKHVALAVPGEPKINQARAKQLLQRVRAEMAKQSSVPTNAITVEVNDAAGLVTVEPGKKGGVLVKGEAQEFGACSEMFLATSLIEVREDLAKAGVRAIVCRSDGCQGVFDLRPTSEGGGVYAGEQCLYLADALRLSGIRVPQ
jgi:hypothetical protein